MLSLSVGICGGDAERSDFLAVAVKDAVCTFIDASDWAIRYDDSEGERGSEKN